MSQPVLFNARTNDKIILKGFEYVVIDTYPNSVILDFQGQRIRFDYDELITLGAVFS
ncbi:hypothetical protein CAL7716_059580 [Calothrix sp. PCC 7716]|nr:hypothetical protein CAL7716_059580 [Calothrix sp. PCC 7716]